MSNVRKISWYNSFEKYMTTTVPRPLILNSEADFSVVVDYKPLPSLERMSLITMTLLDFAHWNKNKFSSNCPPLLH